MILRSSLTTCLNHHRRISINKSSKLSRSRISKNWKRNPKLMNGNATDTEDNQYEVACLADHCNSVASGCAANAFAIAATANDVYVIFGGDYGASYVNGDTADCLFVAIFHER
ncbi:hypothetical protein L2E82_14480 [Cichorium intybus]|uniref:Uncharacterized protein n=1 Tax=Cichorium intybus TaxID=13427 RepID=A0ACB9F193_CICIN|nr:hypothetical protein L2E82_14480 [Cichorium intybus]